MRIDVKQYPGIDYPTPVNHVRIVEETHTGLGIAHQPFDDHHQVFRPGPEAMGGGCPAPAGAACAPGPGAACPPGPERLILRALERLILRAPARLILRAPAWLILRAIEVRPK